MGFELYKPERRARVSAEGDWIRLTTRRIRGEVVGQDLRVTTSALRLIGMSTRRGDDVYFLIEVDRESGQIRMTPTENRFEGRKMNPTNRQMSLPKSFREWTGWGESQWRVEAEDGALVGRVREPIPGATD